MYGFRITVIASAGEPDSLSSKLDEITDQLALACHGNDGFKGYMVMERGPGEVTFLITADAGDEARAMTLAISWLHAAVHAAGFATPGWLRCAEQVFDDCPA
jgi:hypothetical protein